MAVGIAARIRKVDATSYGDGGLCRARHAWEDSARPCVRQERVWPFIRSGRILANSSGCRLIAVDYRRAPEHPFPDPLEDCWDALRAVAGESGNDPLIIAGDSAGGNMAAVCAPRARDRGGPALALQVLVCPVVDHDMANASYREHGSGPDLFLTAEDMAWFWNHYVPEPAARSAREVSPLRARG